MKRKIVVVGDVMLDVRSVVRTTGPSKENTAVMVAKADSTTFNLGGAANVARCVDAIGGDVHLLGFNSDRRVEHLAERIPHTFDSPPMGMTPVKNRIVTTDGHYMLRLDDESNFFGRSDEWWNGGGGALGEKFQELVFPGKDAMKPVVCLVDYDKGCLTNAAAKSLLYHVHAVHDSFKFPVIADPGRHGLWYKFGTPRTIFRANLQQAWQLYQYLRNSQGGVGVTPWTFGTDVTQKLSRKEYEEALFWTAHNLISANIPYHYLVLTLGPGGIIGAPRENPKAAYYVCGATRPVVDACGAGDVVTATMATVLANQPDCMSVNAITGALSAAQHAAQVAVSMPGVYAVTKEDMGWCT
jgi:bifunctional ADP-heptose synthase (sugar kinase/adenylyltransferase)